MSPAPDDPAPGHRRRKRYAGTHPRRFEERYKELDAERYPGIVEHVRAKGRTPAGRHLPILVEEVLDVLAPAPGERAVDATLGWGGHAERLLARLRPGGTLLALDADPVELPRTEARLRALGHGEDALLARRRNFAGLKAVLKEVGWTDGADLLLADLGVSSMQLDDPRRGFTFSGEGPLDMRMNPSHGIPATEWLRKASVRALERALGENADEPHAEPLARALHAGRHRIATTRDLADTVRGVVGKLVRGDEAEMSVRRTFQALRIAVNDEFSALETLLRDLPACLRPGARVAFITFHSGEDRRVKHAFQAGVRDGTYAEVARRVIRAGEEERRDNPRSRPAKLRWAKRAGPGAPGSASGR